MSAPVSRTAEAMASLVGALEVVGSEHLRRYATVCNAVALGMLDQEETERPGGPMNEPRWSAIVQSRLAALMEAVLVDRGEA